MNMEETQESFERRIANDHAEAVVPHRGARDPREHEHIYQKLNKLNMQACELIDRLHGKYESLKEGAQTKTGTQIYNLVAAHENFIDEMNLIELNEQVNKARMQVDEITSAQEKLKMRISDRRGNKSIINPDSVVRDDGGSSGEIVRGMSGSGGKFDYLG